MGMLLEATELPDGFVDDIMTGGERVSPPVTI